jgi:hypothetical protein
VDAAVDCGELRRFYLALSGQFLLDGLFILVEGALEQLQDLALEPLMAALEILVELPERVLPLLRHSPLLSAEFLLEGEEELLDLGLAHHEVASEVGGGGGGVVLAGGVELLLRLVVGRVGLVGLALVELLLDLRLPHRLDEPAVLVGVPLVLGEQVVEVQLLFLHSLYPYELLSIHHQSINGTVLI